MFFLHEISHVFKRLAIQIKLLSSKSLIYYQHYHYGAAYYAEHTRCANFSPFQMRATEQHFPVHGIVCCNEHCASCFISYLFCKICEWHPKGCHSYQSHCSQFHLQKLPTVTSTDKQYYIIILLNAKVSIYIHALYKFFKNG